MQLPASKLPHHHPVPSAPDLSKLTNLTSEGVLSDESGAVVVKPCTAAEISFYSSLAASHPDLAAHVPTFMGSLSLSDTSAIPSAPNSGTIETASGTERLHGKKLATDLHIVLENATHGFTRPNVLDLKLGARLWDDAAKPDKRARLDKVSAESTSGSLGFRIAGMRTWMGAEPRAVPGELADFVSADADGYWVYNKMYGRKFAAGDVREGFDAYVFPHGKEAVQSEAERTRAGEVLAVFLSEVRDAVKVLESKESRMYSASILLVYEGDPEAYEQSKKVLVAAAARPQGEDDEDDDEDDNEPKLAVVKLIDFAHASFCPGQGPDENALRGMRATVGILEEMLDEVEKGL
jgi:1D-myo-inositol-tetrakisphosphate 5-kinase/inositol-polyphosphate multikinase